MAVTCWPRRQARRPVPPGGRESDPALIMCTSGSTGTPKAPVHTFAGLAVQQQMDRWLRRHVPGGLTRRFLHHAGDMLSPEVEHVMWTLAAGGSAVLLGDVGPSQVIEALDRERVTHLYCMPRLLEELTAEIGRGPAGVARYPHLCQVEYGSAPADPGIVKEALDGFGPRLVQVYASSEMAYVTVLGTDEHTPGLLGSVGKPLPGCVSASGTVQRARTVMSGCVPRRHDGVPGRSGADGVVLQRGVVPHR
ncbi:AMP-binding protein [Streptomyces stramineus]